MSVTRNNLRYFHDVIVTKLFLETKMYKIILFIYLLKQEHLVELKLKLIYKFNRLGKKKKRLKKNYKNSTP